MSTAATQHRSTAPLTRPDVASLVSVDGADQQDAEALRTLRSLAQGKNAPLPPEVLAQHVLDVTPGGDWPLRRAALEAILRRAAFARRDELRVASRPRGKDLVGSYSTKGADRGARPYRTLLTSLTPLRGSCDCRDFSRSSLGLCKHLLVVAGDAWPRRAKLSSEVSQAPTFSWDPVRPLTGTGDWLARVRLQSGVAPRGRPSHAMTSARRHFSTSGVLAKGEQLLDPRHRREVVKDLLAVTGGKHETSVDPALRALLAAEQARLDTHAESAVSSTLLASSLKGLKQPLYPYQRVGVARFLATGRLLLADDMGLGKTAQAIAACHALWSTKQVSRGLLVVPASLKPQWLREWRQFTDAPATLVDGSPSERRALYRRRERGFLIVNYEQIVRDLEEVKRFDPELVVLDEAQRIKNWATKTAIYVKELKPARRLVLTGTPLENRLEELASIIDWVDDMALEPKWRLEPWHTTRADGTREVSGARHLDTLRARLAPCMVRRTRVEVLPDLPSRTDTRVPVVLTEAQRAEHSSFDQPIASLAARARHRPLTQAEFLRLMSMLTSQRIICNGLAQYSFEGVWPGIAGIERPTGALLDGLSSPKLAEIRALVENVVVTQRRKVVIFSQWRRMLKLVQWACADVLADAGVKAVFFTGEEGSKRRTQNIVDFHDDDQTRVLFASDAGGVGLNLQHAANAMINVELPWNPAVLEQRIGRIHRLGQKDPIDVFHVVSESGIESRIVNLVGDKRALFTGLFDGASDEVAFARSGSFLSRIEQLVDVPVLPAAPAPEDDADDDAEDDAAVGALADTAPDVADGDVLVPAATAAPEVATTMATAPAQVAGVAAASPTDVAGLFAQLDVRATADGGITITAPAAAAATLAALLGGVARLLSPTGPPAPSIAP